MTSRAEHVAFCKQRALEYDDAGDLVNALNSLTSDLSKHKETQHHAAIVLGTMLAMRGDLDTPEQMREWIEGCR